MKKENKKVLSLILTLALVSTSLFSTGGIYATEVETKATQPEVTLSDISGHWGEKCVNKAVSAGFVNGYKDGTFKPNQAVTRAEFVTMVNKALNLRDENTVNLVFKDVKASDWYYNDIQKASYAQYVDGISDTSFMPGKVITREEAATILSRLLPKAGHQDEALLSAYPDIAKISKWAKSGVAVTVNKGYMTGYKNGNLVPKGTLTRAEAAKIIGSIIEKETIVTEDVSVKDAGEILKDKIYVGDITIEKSVGEGEATLDNLSALSKVIVLGGGVHTVKVKNSLVIQLIVTKEGSKVRILSDGNTVIHETLVFNDNLVVDSKGEVVSSGQGGYEKIIYIKATFSAQDALRIASEIAKRIDNTGSITKQQVIEGIVVIAPDSTVVSEDNGNYVVTTTAAESNNSSSSSGSLPDTSLADAKVAAHSALAAALATHTETHYMPADWIVLTGYKTAGDTAIDAATTVALVNAAKYTAMGGMVNVQALMVNGLPATMTAITDVNCTCGLPLSSIGAFTHTVEFDVDGIVGGLTATGYAIETEAQLQHLGLHLDATAAMMNDLDFTGIVAGSTDPLKPMGALKAAIDLGSEYNGHPINNFENGNFVPIGDGGNPYTGKFYGNDKIITGLIISGSTADHVGIFGLIVGASVQDVTIKSGTILGLDIVGSLVGEIRENSTVVNSSNMGAVSGSSCVGGITGINAGIINKTFNTGDVSGDMYVGGIVGKNDNVVTNSYNAGKITGFDSAGGIIGMNDYLSVLTSNCFNTGEIAGGDSLGGIVGRSWRGSISDCYNIGPVEGSEYNFGGIVGWMAEGVIIEGCYNAGIISGEEAGGIVGYDGNTPKGSTLTECFSYIEANCTVNSWTIFEEAMVDINAMPEHLMEDILDKMEAIESAIANLVTASDLTAYNAILAAVSESDYTTESWNAYQLNLEGCEVTNGNTQAEVDLAVSKIALVQMELVGLSDMTAYDAILLSVVESDYTTSSWENYQIDIALYVALTGKDEQSDIDFAVSQITAAQMDLVELTDLTAYNAILASVDEADYTTVSWVMYQSDIAMWVMTDENTQAEVDFAVSQIELAKTDLVELSDMTAYDAILLSVVDADYTVASWLDYQVAIAPYVSLTNKDEQANIDFAVSQITNAQGDLVLLTDLTAYNNVLAAVTETNYTMSSWADYQVDIIGCVVTDMNTQAEVDAAVAKIAIYQSLLVGLSDMMVYNTALAFVDEANYTVSSWANYQAVISTYLSITNRSTQADVDNAAMAIVTAQLDLVAVADMTAYNAALVLVTEADYTTATWATYMSIVSANVCTRQDLQAEVDSAVTAIMTAQLDLVEVANMTAYNNALAAVTAADYTTFTWAEYLNNISGCVATDQYTQAQVDTATAQIAIFQGFLIEVANMTTYNTILALVTEADYTIATWATYMTVVNANVYTNQDTQADVDNAVVAITAAQLDLVTVIDQALLDAADAAVSAFESAVGQNLGLKANVDAALALKVSAIAAVANASGINGINAIETRQAAAELTLSNAQQSNNNAIAFEASTWSAFTAGDGTTAVGTIVIPPTGGINVTVVFSDNLTVYSSSGEVLSDGVAHVMYQLEDIETGCIANTGSVTVTVDVI